MMSLAAISDRLLTIAPQHAVFLAGLSAYLIIRGVFQSRCARDRKVVRRDTLFDWVLVVLIATAQVVFPLVFLFTPLFKWADRLWPQFVAVIGTLVYGFGLWLFWRSHVDLGRSWSVTLKLNENHRLVTDGVYRFARHPMYAAFFVLAIGQGLLLNNWFAGWSALVATAVLYLIRRPHEERMMLDHFGDEYAAYCRRTGGLLPRLRRSS